MAWIKSEQALANHPKLKLLAKELEISEVEALGYLHLVWYWTLEYAEDGNITKYAQTLPEMCKWEGDTDIFINALVKFEFIDKTDKDELLIHDWLDYSGAYLEKRWKNTMRKRESRERLQNSVTNSDNSVTFNDIGVTKNDSHTLDKIREDKSREEYIEGEQVRNKDLIFENLANVCGMDWTKLTKSERGRLNQAVKELKEVGATPEDVLERGQNFVLSYGFNPSPQSLPKLWTSLAQVKPRLTKQQLDLVQREATNVGRWDKLKEEFYGVEDER